MSRPFKSGVDYFPLDVKMEDEVELIEAEHGIVGFGVLIKLYQKIYSNNFWVGWNKKEAVILSKRINVDINTINSIINSCLEWELFDKNMYEKYNILTSKGVQKRFFEIIKRRKKADVVKKYLLIDLKVNADINSVNVDINPVNVDINPVNVSRCVHDVYKSTQSKVKETEIEKKEKEKETEKEKKEKEKKVLRPETKFESYLNRINGKKSRSVDKLSFEKYKEAFIWKQKNINKPFKEKALNDIMINYPYIMDYDLDGTKFKVTYNDYKKL